MIFASSLFCSPSTLLYTHVCSFLSYKRILFVRRHCSGWREAYVHSSETTDEAFILEKPNPSKVNVPVRFEDRRRGGLSQRPSSGFRQRGEQPCRPSTAEGARRHWIQIGSICGRKEAHGHKETHLETARDLSIEREDVQTVAVCGRVRLRFFMRGSESLTRSKPSRTGC